MVGQGRQKEKGYFYTNRYSSCHTVDTEIGRRKRGKKA